MSMSFMCATTPCIPARLTNEQGNVEGGFPAATLSDDNDITVTPTFAAPTASRVPHLESIFINFRGPEAPVTDFYIAFGTFVGI